MKYTKAMIDLIFTIRKAAPQSSRAKIKLSNPALLDTLVHMYNSGTHAELEHLIFELLSLLGPDWVKKTQAETATAEQVTKARGNPSAALPANPTPGKSKKKTLTYRGQRLVVSGP